MARSRWSIASKALGCSRSPPTDERLIPSAPRAVSGARSEPPLPCRLDGEQCAFGDCGKLPSGPKWGEIRKLKPRPAASAGAMEDPMENVVPGTGKAIPFDNQRL